jgi:hypothetical protein
MLTGSYACSVTEDFVRDIVNTIGDSSIEVELAKQPSEKGGERAQGLLVPSAASAAPASWPVGLWFESVAPD